MQQQVLAQNVLHGMVTPQHTKRRTLQDKRLSQPAVQEPSTCMSLAVGVGIAQASAQLQFHGRASAIYLHA